ncbi:MAG: FtsW/RodA/SpoVE family cell cycle protein [Treponema sp.]|nr:FtsW/RodA/SpoVE family cell cycle protein [Treponema sp.]
MPLPFFSAGGSSLATSLICAGLIANVARKARSPSMYENIRDEDQDG